MLRRSATFLFRGGFLARASLFELAAGLMVVYSLQQVFDRLIVDIVLPIIASLVGGLDFADSFSGLSHAVTATNLADAKKQGAVFAYGNFLTALIQFLIVFLVLTLVVRAKIAVTSSLRSDADQRSHQSN
jgi:large conductance mechanosensitive channel